MPDVKFFLTSRQPDLRGAAPTDLVREGATDRVIDWLSSQLPDDIAAANERQSEMARGYDEEAFLHDHERLDAANPISQFVAAGSIEVLPRPR